MPGYVVNDDRSFPASHAALLVECDDPITSVRNQQLQGSMTVKSWENPNLIVPVFVRRNLKHLDSTWFKQVGAIRIVSRRNDSRDKLPFSSIRDPLDGYSFRIAKARGGGKHERH